MKQRSSGGSRRATTGGADGRSFESALMASSLLLWLPYSLAAIYVAYCSSFITEVPLSTTGSPSAAVVGSGGALGTSVTGDGSGGQGFGASSSSAAVSTAAGSFASSEASVIAMGSVAGTEASSAAFHRYSSFYYYVFPADFDIAVFMPLLLRVVPFSVLAIIVTFYFAVYRYNGGEWLMAVAWALGTCSDFGWLTSRTSAVQSTVTVSGLEPAVFVSAAPPSWLWVVVSLLTGFFSGILCKVKDIVDGKHDRDTHLFPLFDRSHSAARNQVKSAGGPPVGADSGAVADDSGNPTGPAARRRQPSVYTYSPRHLVSLGDRLYMVVPFCTGQWFAFILHHGWRGIVVENGAILLSLALVGYTMLSYKFLKRQVLRASGRVTRSVAARGRNRRNERRLRQKQEQRRQQQSSGLSGEDANATSTPPAERAALRTASAEGSGVDSSSAGVSPGAAALTPDTESEEEITDFFEDVGEVAFIDVIDLISKLFTTSFGVVVLGVLGLNIFMTSLCIPFLKALFKLNALVSGVGIVIELIMYEVA